MIDNNRRLRVTFCSYDKPDSVGGPISWIQTLLPSLRDCGLDVNCLFLLHWGESGPALSALERQGISCTATLAHPTTEERVSWLLNQMKEDPPDVFVPNLVVAAYHAATVLKASGISTVGVIHSDDDFYKGLIEEFVVGSDENRVSGLVCVSEELERQVQAHNRIPPTRRIPCGVPVPKGSVSRIPHRFRIAYSGRLSEEQKRVSDLTRAFCNVVRDVPGTQAAIFGDGPDRSNVESILATTDCRERVHFYGAVSREDLAGELMHTEAIVLLSDYEGVPVALMEAMAAGCVPVCLRIRSGIPELVKNDITGLIVDDRADSFTRAIRRLSEDQDLWYRLSEAARAKIADEFSDTVCATKWFDFLTYLRDGLNRPESIVVPSRLQLPPINPKLSSADRRKIKVTLGKRAYLGARMLAKRLRQRLQSLLP